jgi:MFS family permease
VAPAGAKGAATGIYASCQFLGAFAGGAVGGWLLQTLGPSLVMLVCALLVLVWLLVAWFMKPPRYLASLLIPLGDQPRPGLAERLAAVEGVEEVVLLEGDSTAYLKVDPRRVDRTALTELIESAPPDTQA